LKNIIKKSDKINGKIKKKGKKSGETLTTERKMSATAMNKIRNKNI